MTMNNRAKNLFAVIGIIATVSVAFYWVVMKPLMYVQEIELNNYELNEQVLKLQKENKELHQRIGEWEQKEQDFRISKSFTAFK